MKAIITSLGKEFKLVFRNGISLFMALAPAILAIVFILIFGATQSASLKLAVSDQADAGAVEMLSRIADIELFSDETKLLSRVRATDAVAGIVIEDGAPVLVFAGDEGDDYMAGTRQLVQTALSGAQVSYQAESIEPKGSLAYNVSMIAILLMSLFIGGATIGFSIVNERESNMISAVSVSPLKLANYILIKLIPSLVLSIAGITIATLIMGRGQALPGFLLLALFSVPVSGLFIFLIGAFAANQIAAVGVMKALMPISMILPISAFFVHGNWRIAYYIFPMYWQYRAIDAINNGGAMLFPCLMSLAVGTPWFLMMAFYFAKKTKIRIGR
ncbi:MAG TPA: ABC transporter permease [Oscillospiraceae bacterium]|nr:ABC transporter permease [Oscillospiraceae bacterium]HPF55316.1 ABC transporter permease [Clostridiales bacterium]HPK36100.1 ABC transporter permease [Oscillospiraceae bacterium]HPR76615.1 ABC transporter permease [Oscillospiraceae bacterium]